MATNEEYLDNLLKAVEEVPNPQDNQVIADTESGEESESEELVLEESVLGGTDIEEIDAKESQETEYRIEETGMDEHEAEEHGIEESVSVEMAVESGDNEEEEWKANLDEILAAVDNAEEQLVQSENNDDSHLQGVTDDMDVTQIIDGMEHSGDDLAEISNMLKKSDQSEAVEADKPKQVDHAGTDSQSDGENEGKAGKKGKKKKKSLLPSKKKKKKKGAEDSSSDIEAKAGDLEEADASDGLEGSEPDGADESVEAASKESVKEETGDKSKGFLGRFFEKLLQEEEEPEENKNPEENAETEKKSENQAGKKKEKKKKEKPKKEKKTQKQKPKKEKKKKEKPEVPLEKPVKVLTTKALIVLVAFCATIIAAIVLLSIFIPDYVRRQNAKTSFYAGKYDEVYTLLYEKNLSQNEEVLFNRADVILQLQRRLDSYELNKKLERNVEALDALLQGVQRYDELMEGETYGTTENLRNTYQAILGYLSADYGIGEEKAREINGYDDDSYSREIYLIANGINIENQGNEQQSSETESEAPLDILPEEEGIINLAP